MTSLTFTYLGIGVQRPQETTARSLAAVFPVLAAGIAI